MTRAFIASMATETNCHSPFPTGMSAWELGGITRKASLEKDGFGGQILSVYRELAEAAGYEVVESLTLSAEPAGKTVQSVYEGFRDAILTDLAAAGEVRLVLLLLHGAMVATGYDDCEADLVERIRAIVPDAAIGVELDLHCHLSAELVRAADFVIPYKEYPHVDGSERAAELFDLCHRKLAGELAPVAALIDTRMIGFYPTFDEPMRSIVALARAIEGEPGILSASIAHGFPWADVADVGTRILVYADRDPALASGAAERLAERLYAAREELRPTYPGIAESLDRAANLEGRVVLGDYSDNPGGGAPCDSTFFLRAILERGLGEVAIGSFYDPVLAQVARDAGVGARLAVRLGGKTGPMSGDPVDLEVEVMGIAADHTQSCFEARTKTGLTVWLRHAGIDILVNDLRTQVYGTDFFTGLGIDLGSKRLIVVKSSSHFEHDFGPVADHMWRVSSPGALDIDMANFTFTRRDNVFHPRLADPWATHGRPVPLVIAGRSA
ncbi:M81 family metallopeptidase [Erythrobacter sp. NE805]|uniref:M81 family metallopeptidase n=1 Tax=Erythrobacter sp. NE805 TaxID=3389875 RepID=UPI00396AFABE